MYHCGTEVCAPGHGFGPAVRDHFLIHYIVSGKGMFHVGDDVYHLCMGQGFLIYPGIVTYYKADEQNPWHYFWVGFHGLKTELYLKQAGLTVENPIFTSRDYGCTKQCFDDMLASANRLSHGRDTCLLGLLYLFLSQLIEDNGQKGLPDTAMERTEGYIKQALAYIHTNYSRKISVAEIAHHVGLDRSYLGSLVHERLNTTLQQYLLRYRIEKACELIQDTGLSIGDISRSVGYADPLLFSRMFKRVKDISPREYGKSSGRR